MSYSYRDLVVWQKAMRLVLGHEDVPFLRDVRAYIADPQSRSFHSQ